ncbi:arsenate reductase/protein-tyrosine-phosphatase family protein [Methanoplanus limicola]|uniref:Protein tyrosine phosphatase n=1 Tax=Methanoplanus limicola DSM 2279 TaxID=937775 RepID=H1YZ92_9EURY|nr:low molecular weight phosphatase family protein [Methanoplanus limicola]EHQ35116.1 protein tyrosine phosphatase [Methanoplanus limicola DSM 2279]
MVKKQKILFICTYNSVRSQMAEAIINSRYSEKFHADSAGLIPGGVDPYAISALNMRGIDTSGLTSKSIGRISDRKYSMIIFLCENARMRAHYLPVSDRTECRLVSLPPAEGGDPVLAYSRLADILINMFETDPLFN